MSVNRYKEKDWIEIGKRCSAGRRSMWLRINPDSIELCAGREGDDIYVKILPSNPKYSELLDLFTTAEFAATT